MSKSNALSGAVAKSVAIRHISTTSNTEHGLKGLTNRYKDEGHVLFNALNTFYLRLYGKEPLR